MNLAGKRSPAKGQKVLSSFASNEPPSILVLPTINQLDAQFCTSSDTLSSSQGPLSRVYNTISVP